MKKGTVYVPYTYINYSVTDSEKRSASDQNKSTSNCQMLNYMHVPHTGTSNRASN